MECPVCGRVFSQDVITTHVEMCLLSSESPDKLATNSQPSSKRKLPSTWGSLQPMRSTKQSDPSVGTVKKTKFEATMSGSKTSGFGPGLSVEKETETRHENANESCSLRPIPTATPERPSRSSLPSSKSKNGPSTEYRDTCNKEQGQTANEGRKNKTASFAPLAERVRPKDLNNYFGQDKAVGKGSMLYSLLASDHIPSIILWGPPGCGKTTLARIIANNCRFHGNAKFLSLSAAVCGVNEVKDTIKIARNDQKMFRRKTIMFLDEIHRFNKTQQDVLLPHIEDGTITLIGATTENPSFQINSALLSRCRVIVLEKLSSDSILTILMNALPIVGAVAVESQEDPKDGTVAERPDICVHKKALELLANLVDGDARAALNGLQMAVDAKRSDSVLNQAVSDYDDDNDEASVPGCRRTSAVTMEDIKEGLQRSHILYDRTGEEHYNIISVVHKSMRGSDVNASLYWLARMLEGGENPLYIARRLIRFASEDVGLADPQALPQAVAAYQGCHLIGMPECEVLLAQCVVYLARAPKSAEMYKAYSKAKACVRDHKGPLPSVPLHLRNAPTRLMKNLGYGKGYKYNPDFKEPVDQTYFPDELLGTDFFT